MGMAENKQDLSGQIIRPKPDVHLETSYAPIRAGWIGKQSQGALIALALVSSNLFGLFLAGIYEFLSLRGVVNVQASRLVLFAVWLIGCLLSGFVAWAFGIKAKVRTAGASGLILFVLLWGLDWWAPKPKEEGGGKGPTEVLFSDSPFLDDARKDRLRSLVQGYYSHLEAAGLAPPRQTPMLVPDKNTVRWTITGGPSNPNIQPFININESSVDDAGQLLEAYSLYAFDEIIQGTPPYADSANRDKATFIIAWYFSSDYLGYPAAKLGEFKWIEALWELRSTFDARYVNRSLVAQTKSMNDKLKRNAYYNDFDRYMSWYFDLGETSVSNLADRFLAVDRVLIKHGITTVH
jgi:hypothetical protein